MDDELEACRAALDEIASICSSYKGVTPRDEEAPPSEAAEPALEIEIESAAPAEEEIFEEEPPPMSIVERPSAREEERPFKRPRGRPRRGSY